MCRAAAYLNKPLNTRIEIDGGVDTDNIARIVEAGAEIIVAGSAVYGKGNATKAVQELLDATTVWA